MHDPRNRQHGNASPTFIKHALYRGVCEDDNGEEQETQVGVRPELPDVFGGCGQPLPSGKVETAEDKLPGGKSDDPHEIQQRRLLESVHRIRQATIQDLHLIVTILV